MSQSLSLIRQLIREEINNTRIIPERPWSISINFTIGQGSASDSEGPSQADGLGITLSSPSTFLHFKIDTYWNPQTGDQSGNSIKIIHPDPHLPPNQSHVPYPLNNNQTQTITISNSPVTKTIYVALAPSPNHPPITWLHTPCPFPTNEDISIHFENMGNGLTSAHVAAITNL